MIGWAVEALIASALLMALVLAIRAPVRAAFGPGVAYALWTIPVLRLLLPSDLMPRLWPEAANPISDAGAVIYVLDVAPASTQAHAAPLLGEIIAWLWLAGGLAFLGWQAIAFLNLRHRLLCGASERERVGGVRVVEARSGEGPLAFGILERFVVLPADFRAAYDADEQRLALAHELAHHKRGDLIANAVALGVLALHWFNPLAWFAFRAFRADQEMACDARVIAADPGLRHAYGLAIVKSARGGAISAACHLHTIEQLKGRLKMLNAKAKSPGRRLTGAFTAAGLAAIALAATASGGKASAAIEKAGDRVVTALAVPPVPPVPAVPVLSPRPAAPQAAEAPPAPPQPPAVPELTDEDGKVVRKHVRVISRDGKTVTLDGREMPHVSAIDCKDEGEGSHSADEMTSVQTKDGKKIIVICKNRIQKHAEAATRAAIDAEKIRREAMASALASLDTARSSVAAARELSDADRAEALAGIEEARAELEAELSKGE